MTPSRTLDARISAPRIYHHRTYAPGHCQGLKSYGFRVTAGVIRARVMIKVGVRVWDMVRLLS